MLTLQDKLSIIKSQFNIEIKEIEPEVYEVLNINQEINIEKLQWALEECILITSDLIRTEKLDNGIHISIMRVYGIITKHNKELAWKYDDIFSKKYETTLIMDYICKPDKDNSIGTLYSPQEM